MISDAKWTRICDSSLLTSKLQLRGKMEGGQKGKKKKNNIALNPSKPGKTLSWVYRTSERRAIDTEEERDAGEERKGEMEGKEFDFRVSRCPFRRCKLTNRW